MVAEAGGRDAGSEAQVRGGAQSTEPRPDKRALALLGGPGVKVIRGHHRSEARLLGLLAPFEQVRWVELLEHRRVSDRSRGLHVASFVAATSFAVRRLPAKSKLV